MRKYLSCLLLLITVSSKAFSAPAEVKKTTDFYFVGVPKCGTHLLQKAIYYLNNESFDRCEPYLHPSNLAEDLFFMQTHPKKKFIIIVRDPRDALVSAFEFIGHGPIDHDKNPKAEDYWHLPLRMNPDFLYMSDQEKVSHMIKMDIGNLLVGSEKMHSSYLVSVLAGNLPNVKVVRFEDLIGTNGGGDDDIQRETLQQIACFLNLSTKNVENAVKKTWGPEDQHAWKTFRHGIKGRWKSFFDQNLIYDIKNYGAWNEFILHYGYESTKDW